MPSRAGSWFTHLAPSLSRVWAASLAYRCRRSPSRWTCARMTTPSAAITAALTSLVASGCRRRGPTAHGIPHQAVEVSEMVHRAVRAGLRIPQRHRAVFAAAGQHRPIGQLPPTQRRDDAAMTGEVGLDPSSPPFPGRSPYSFRRPRTRHLPIIEDQVAKGGGQDHRRR
jgi:hypothetical protein